MITKQSLFWPISIGIAFIFQTLFFSMTAGLNYAVFTMLLLSVLMFYIKPKSYSHTFKFILLLYVSVTVAVIFAHTVYSIFIYWIFTTMLISVACYSKIIHVELAPLLFINGLESFFSSRKDNGDIKLSGKLKPFVKFIFLPFFTILILLWLYSFSNPLFHKSISKVMEHLINALQRISFPRIFFTLLGLVMAIIFISNRPSDSTINADTGIKHHLIRIRKRVLKFGGLNKLLLRKKQVAVAAFIILNAMIGWLNYLDITNIWTNFNWDGGFLKDMVHEGTSMLIVAILISIGITLFYLKSNLVFIKNNSFFYGLLILWLMQNILMAISVSIRNTIYIEHFSLAYKRIFVYFFLLACVVGLLSIIYKIVFRRSISFIISVNSISVLAILLISSCFNWDKIIAKHNFENYKQSFVHYKFLASLNNSALPYLLKSKAELDTIYLNQADKFPFVRGREYDEIDYQYLIEKRKTEFIAAWKSKNMLEWNYPESVAFIELSETK